jgi:aspartyl-tRNA(Asn)/glutamyl-tRNA(Gln) amidotransferase subunit A
LGVDPKTLELLAKEILRRDPGDSQITESVGRLESILSWVRGVDEARLRETGPAGLLNTGHPAWRGPAPEHPAWETVVPTGRGSGYGSPPQQQQQAGAARPDEGGARTDRQPAGVPIPDGVLALSLTEVARRIRAGEVSPVEVVGAALRRIEQLSPELNAFITVTAETAMREAHEAAGALIRERRSGGGVGDAIGPLHGVPVAIKDIMETAGVRTTCGSRILAEYVPASDATVVRRLKAAGAIVVGKTNTHEFAFGPTNVNPHYGPCRNPHNPARVSGGSSGGSAAAVVSGQAYLGMGTDTGGSIRIPAACCGVVGLKPTYGLVSKAGIFPLSWSLDHPGPLVRTAEDAALVLSVLAGPDPLDPSTAVAGAAAGAPGHAGTDYLGALQQGRGPGCGGEYGCGPGGPGLRGVTVGVPRGWLEKRVDPAVTAAVREAISRLEDCGAAVREIDFPGADPMMLANRLIILAEAAAYHMPWLRTRADEYGADVRARLELGQYLMAVDYLAGQRLRAELCQTVAGVMREVDLVVTPALPVPAPYIGQDHLRWPDGLETVPDALIRFAAPFNVTGQPAASVPYGTSDGLPVGVQIVGRWFEETTVLRAASALGNV